jgi:hypothetical protein
MGDPGHLMLNWRYMTRGKYIIEHSAVGDRARWRDMTNGRAPALITGALSLCATVTVRNLAADHDAGGECHVES